MQSSLEIQIAEKIETARNHKTKNLAFAYARISSKKQEDGNSKAAQIKGINTYAQRNNLYIIHLFATTESAWSPGRIDFNLMIRLAKKHNIKHLIFKNHDRISRNDEDWLTVDKMIKQEVQFHLYEFNKILDSTRSAEEKFGDKVTSGLNEYWSDKISQGVRRGYNEKAFDRRVAHKAPLGYEWEASLKNWIIDPEKMAVVKYMFELYDSSGNTLQEIADLLNAHGYTTVRDAEFTKSRVHQILHNRFYTGWFQYKNEWIKGTHEPVISDDLFQERISRMDDRYNGNRKSETTYNLSKYVRCSHCGMMYTGYKVIKSDVYYNHHCEALNGKYRIVKESEIVTALDDYIETIVYSDQYSMWLKKTFSEIMNDKSSVTERERAESNKKIRELQSSKSKLLDMYLSDEFTKEEIDKKAHEINTQITVLEDRLVILNKDLSNHFNKVLDIVDYLKNFTKTFLLDSIDGKMEFLRAMSYVMIYDDDNKKVAEIQWKKAFAYLLARDFTTQIPPTSLDLVSPFTYAWRDDFRTNLERWMCA